MRRLTKNEQREYVQSNLGLIHYTIKRFFSWLNIIGSNKSQCEYYLFDYEDLYNEGVLGLIKAAQKFDKSRKRKFSTFAVYYIRLYIQKGIYQIGTRVLNFPQNICELKYRIDRKNKYEHLTYYELYERGYIDLDTYHIFMRMKLIRDSLTVEIAEKVYGNIFKDDKYKDIIYHKDDEEYYKKFILYYVKKCFKKNRRRNYYIIIQRIGYTRHKRPLTYNEIIRNLRRRFPRRGRISIITIKRIVKQFNMYLNENMR